MGCLCRRALTLSLLYFGTGFGSKYPGSGHGSDCNGVGEKMGLLFGFLVLVLSLIFRKVIQIMGFDFQRVFNGSLLILGLMTLLFALTVPNITNTMEMNFSPIVIEEPFQLLIVVGGLLGLIVWGAFSQRLIVKEERENAGNSRI